MGEPIKEKVSVIIPAYNVEKYMDDCITSLEKQTYTDIEIIIAYTKSGDNTGKICFELAEKYDNIKVIETQQAGVSNARNMALDTAKGEYIAFVDADDWVQPDYIDALVKGFAGKCRLSMCGYDRVRANGSTEYFFRQEILNNYEKYSLKTVKNTEGDRAVFSQEDTIGLVLCNNTIGGYLWNKLFSRKLIEDNKIRFLADLSIGEDMTFIAEYMKYIDEASYLARPLYHYRLNENSALQRMYTTGEWEEGKLSNMKAAEYISDIYSDYIKKINLSENAEETRQNECNKADIKIKKIRAAVDYRSVRTGMWTFFNMLKCNHCDADVLKRIKTTINGRWRCYCANENTKRLEKIVSLGILIAPKVVFRAAGCLLKIIPESLIGRYLK